MPYCDQTLYIARFGERELIDLCDRVNQPPVAMDADADAVFDRAARAADSVIDGYLGVKYATPISPPTEGVLDMAADLTRDRLHIYVEPDHAVRKRAAEHLALLRDIARGMAKLPGVAGVEPAATAGGGVQWQSGERVFARDQDY